MLNAKQIKRKLCLLLTCSLCWSALSACNEVEQVAAKPSLPSLHAANVDLATIYKQTEAAANKSAHTDTDQASLRMQELQQLIVRYLEKKNLSQDHVAIELYNFKREEHFALNADKYFTAASTYKFPLAVIYYDLLRQGRLKKDQQLRLDEAELVENNGVGAQAIGSLLNVDALLNPMILYSDNTAAHVLFEELGGFQRYKEMVCESIGMRKDPAYLAEGNKITAQILTAFARKVYTQQDNYPTLLANLQKAEPVHYLNLLPSMHNVMHQKYGSYEEALNSVGLKLDGPEQYSLVVLTNLGGAGEQVVGELSALVYAFYHPDKLQAETIIKQANVFQSYYQPAPPQAMAEGDLGTNLANSDGDDPAKSRQEDDPSAANLHEHSSSSDDGSSPDYGANYGADSDTNSGSGSEADAHTGSGSGADANNAGHSNEPNKPDPRQPDANEPNKTEANADSGNTAGAEDTPSSADNSTEDNGSSAGDTSEASTAEQAADNNTSNQ